MLVPLIPHDTSHCRKIFYEFNVEEGQKTLLPMWQLSCEGEPDLSLLISF